MSIFADNIILYVKISKTQKVLELINEFSKVTEYKINIQNQVFLYKNKIYEKKNPIQLTIASKTKYLRINLTIEAKDMCNEIYKTVVERNWRHKKALRHQDSQLI